MKISGFWVKSSLQSEMFYSCETKQKLFFGKEDCILLKPSNFKIIYYEQIYKHWFVETFFDALIHASILFCYPIKKSDQPHLLTLSWYHAKNCCFFASLFQGFLLFWLQIWWWVKGFFICYLAAQRSTLDHCR